MSAKTIVLVVVAAVLLVVGVIAASFWCLYERDRWEAGMVPRG